MTITRQDIKNAAEEYMAAKQQLEAVKQAYAEQECPLKVGDIVDVIGWSYKGKKMKVTRIEKSKWTYDKDWKVVGIVLKKDGSEGKNTAGFSQYDYEERQREQEGT